MIIFRSDPSDPVVEAGHFDDDDGSGDDDGGDDDEKWGGKL